MADGSVLKASETENADLFFAIRGIYSAPRAVRITADFWRLGGSSSFGVVTQFVLKTYPSQVSPQIISYITCASVLTFFQGPYLFQSFGFHANARDGIFSALRASI